jgi:AraC-like DNA-binding protein
MAVTYSTSNAHPRDSISYWVEVATKAFVRHEFKALGGPAYRGDIHAGALDGLGVSSFECDSCEVNRSSADIARADSDDVLLVLQLSGIGHFGQDGRHDVNRRGNFLLIDTRRPFTIHFPERIRSVTFKIDRPAIEARLGNLGALTARSIKPEGPVAGLASGFLSMLVARVDLVAGAAASKLADQALDLIALAATAEFGQSGVALSSVRSTTLLRLKSVIEARLREPDVRPAAIAAEVGISVRYANALLSQEDSSVERYLLQRRLERCRQTLDDPAQAHRMIGEIAYAWGFSDLSHFGRRFRNVYGMTAGDYRRRSQEARQTGTELFLGTSL